MKNTHVSAAIVIGVMTGMTSASAQVAAPTPTVATPSAQPAARGARPPSPTRDPRTPGYVTATELPDGAVPSADAYGQFILGPAPYTRRVAVYIPQQYVPGTVAPFIVGADGPDRSLFTALDNLIAQKRVPVMIAISIGNGSGDAQGSQRGLEYDTMSGLYAPFVETEVLPLVEKQYHVRLTKDPDARVTMGCSSGGSAALAMAWYRNDLYRRALTYSGTYVNQQWPFNPETPGGAWECHKSLNPNSPAKPIRLWMHVSDRDNFSESDGMHDWVLANQHMARVLADKGYKYQFVFAQNAGHCDRAVKQQTPPEALEFVWKGYPIDGAKSAR